MAEVDDATEDARASAEEPFLEPPDAPPSPPNDDDVDDDDVGGEDEEDFETGMKNNALDFQAMDKDQDHKLDFDEFCVLVRQREVGDFTDEELQERFTQLDADGSGKVDLHEYVRWSLREALTRSSTRVIDLFKQWDDDGSGEISKKEFRKAIKSMGFDFFADDSEIDMVCCTTAPCVCVCVALLCLSRRPPF